MALLSMPARSKIRDDLNLNILEYGFKIILSDWEIIIKSFIYAFLEPR